MLPAPMPRPQLAWAETWAPNHRATSHVNPVGAHAPAAGDGEGDGDHAFAVARVAAADDHRAWWRLSVCRRASRTGGRRERWARSCPGHWDPAGCPACSRPRPYAAGDILAAIGLRDPVLGPVPGGQEVIGMLAALGGAVLQGQGVGGAGNKTGQPDTLNGGIAFIVDRVVALQVAIDPAAACVARGIASPRGRWSTGHRCR